ncbi:MAG: ATP-binding protein, partial [Blautia sp.]|nr:ATP-binding protein [Blautia sp.]
MLTLDYMQEEHENKYFDRKSAKGRPSDLSADISAFANADGGTLVIGINDKTRELEGINRFGEDKINDFINTPK